MREKKFRIWLPGINKMTYSHTLEELMNWKTKEWTSGTAVFLQYTGLRDKNEKEIFEGDILKVPDLYETPENTSMTYNNQIIEFNDFSYRLNGYPLGENHEYISEECEVIGNIYENSDLMVVSVL